MSTHATTSFLADGLMADDGPYVEGQVVGLLASWCSACARYEFPRRDWCPACGREAECRPLGTTAVVSNVTTLHYPPPGSLIPAPLTAAIADFEGGISILGLVDGESGEIELGAAVQTIAIDVDGRLGWAYRTVR